MDFPYWATRGEVLPTTSGLRLARFPGWIPRWTKNIWHFPTGNSAANFNLDNPTNSSVLRSWIFLPNGKGKSSNKELLKFILALKIQLFGNWWSSYWFPASCHTGSHLKTKIGKKHVVTLLGFHQPSFSLGNVSNKVRQRLLVLEIWWSSFFGQREPLRLSKVKPSKKKQSTMHRYSNFSPIFRVKHSGKFPSEPPLRVDWFHTDLQKKPLWWHHQYADL